MPPETRDAAYLWDILDAANTICRHVSGVSCDAYIESRLIQDAVERRLEIIGVAAGRVSSAFRKEHPEIPWGPIIAQRNVLAHEYGEIKHERIWEVIEVHIPRLIEQLKPLIPPLPPEHP